MEVGGNIHLNTRLDKIEQTLERLEAAILGDKYNRNGHSVRIESLEKEVAELKKARQQNMFIETFVKLFSGAIIGAVAYKLIEHFTK
jgi:hypothetical protein